MRLPTGPRALGARKMRPLSDRQLEVERRIRAGERQCDVARAMGISKEAVARAIERVDDVRSLEAMRLELAKETG